MNNHSNIIEKLDKVQFAFQQSSLIINNKIDNYFYNLNNSDYKKISYDIKNIINEQNNEFETNILNDIIRTIKEERISTIIKGQTTLSSNYHLSMTPSAPDFCQINNIPNTIIPSAPSYNQLVNNTTYIPPITCTDSILQRQTNQRNILDPNLYTTMVIQPPKCQTKKKKSNCIIS